MRFVESNMTFSFSDDRAFRIEKSKALSRLQSVKSCEVVVVDGRGDLMIIEAKSSSPRPESKERLAVYLSDIRNKFVDSLMYLDAVMGDVHGEEAKAEIPVGFNSFHKYSSNLKLVLIVHGNEDEWMPELHSAFREEMRDLINILGIQDNNVKAINHNQALKAGIIIDFT